MTQSLLKDPVDPELFRGGGELRLPLRCFFQQTTSPSDEDTGIIENP